jgi:hypothetical protein
MNNRYLPRAVSSVTPSTDVDNVIDFPIKSITASPFDQLTAGLILDQQRRGVLPEAILVALLAGVGLRP